MFIQKKQTIIYIFLIITFLLKTISLQAQFLFPINPTGKNYLTGNMGEIRPNHFHAGLDIRAAQGTPIYAAADGYVSLVEASTYSYGNVIHLVHPETKHITLYAHLSKFGKEIGEYVRTKQYAQQTFEIRLLPNPTELLVKKGDIIGYVGNTGGSMGPHLHFEIRTLENKVLNPLKFFDNFPDTKAPTIVRLGIRPLGTATRINQKHDYAQYNAAKTSGNAYIIAQTISAFGRIGLEAITYDLADGASNSYATTNLHVKVNGKEIYRHQIENYPHDDIRGMNLHINYLLQKKLGINFQKAYQEDGNPLGIALTDSAQGKIYIEKNKLYNITMEAKDVRGNTSYLNFQIKGQEPPKPIFKADVSPYKTNLRYEVDENTLILRMRGLRENIAANAYINNLLHEIPLAYMQGQEAIYLWDLRKGVPSEIHWGKYIGKINIVQTIPSKKAFTYEDNYFKIHFPERALFDTLYLQLSAKGNTFTIGDNLTPILKEIEVTYKYKNAKALVNKTKTGVFSYGYRQRFLDATFTDSTVAFKAQYLGTFSLTADMQPPTIKLLSKTATRISFAIADNLAGIADFKATLNGNFLLMQHESKQSLIWSDPDYKQPLKGNFELTVRDKLGNVNVYKAVL